LSVAVTDTDPPIKAGELTRTTAPGSVPPWASLTVPMSAPVNPWAAAVAHVSTQPAATREAQNWQAAAAGLRRLVIFMRLSLFARRYRRARR
jgi:hypothetical protein